MRPVFRGPIPKKENGEDKIVSDYKDWRYDLINRIGNYCSYCNMVLNDSPQVEHVTPKNPQPGQAIGALLAWDNMVLACGPCNRAKSNNPCDTNTHYLPDFHNTHLVFESTVVVFGNQKACVVAPRNNLTPTQQAKAEATISLCALDKVLLNPRATDLRWKYRFETLEIAKTWREEWNSWGYKIPEFVSLLCTAATGKGFFSIWFEMFFDVPNVLRALIQSFPNTAPCFDETQGFLPITRSVNDF